MITTKATFVSTDDFYTFTGINLEEELSDDKTPDKFLRDCEDEIINYVNLQSWRPINKWIADNKLSADEMDALRKAILQQAEYVFYNGDLLKNSGIDPESGVKVTPDQRSLSAISPMASDTLRMSGILRLSMKGRW